jgi:hypothetical protein
MSFLPGFPNIRIWPDLETIEWAAVFAALFHYGPKILMKISSSSNWKNPYFKWLTIFNASIVGMSILLAGAVSSWIAGVSAFDWSSILLLIVCTPIFYFFAKARSTVKVDYEASCFIDAIKNGSFKFGSSQRKK